MRILVAVSLALLVGCSLLRGRDKRKDWGEPTLGGFRVQYEDHGTVSSGRLTKSDVFLLFDFAQQNAKHELTTKYGVNPDTYDLYARSMHYLLIDNKNFPTSSSPTGFASGYIQNSTIIVALYSRFVARERELVPPGSPPWTVVSFDGKWSFGLIDPKNPFPALTHELGHKILPGKFNH